MYPVSAFLTGSIAVLVLHNNFIVGPCRQMWLGLSRSWMLRIVNCFDLEIFITVTQFLAQRLDEKLILNPSI